MCVFALPDLQVKVSFPDPPDPTRAELECHSRCGLAGDPPYIWFRNGQNLRHGEKNLVQPRSGGSYSCAVEGHNLSSPLVCKYAPQYTDMIPGVIYLLGKITVYMYYEWTKQLVFYIIYKM